MKEYINQFLEHLEIERGLSKATLTNYHFYLNRFATFSQKFKITNVLEINQELIKKYRLYINRIKLKDGENFKKNTQNYHLISIRSFLKYLAKNNIKALAPEKIELAKQQPRQVNFLESSEIIKILQAPLQIKQESLIKNRDKAILEMLFSTGLRVSELTKLEIKDINLSREEFTIRGKGGKLRLVFLSPEAKKSLSEHLENNKNIIENKKQKIFNLTARSVQRIVNKYAKIAGITKQVTPHTLRHTYATDLLINGADIRSVQTMLGHSSITTTQVYTHITDNQLRDVYKAFHGKQRKKYE